MVERMAPASSDVIRAIARRELSLAARRRLTKLLFLFSVLPPIVLTVAIVIRMMAESMTGAELDFDPILQFLQFQAFPVALLALGIGTPSVARDRAEEVLFLYATRPVQPWHYSLGKMLAVALPSAALMLLPGVLIAVLRLGVTAQLGTGAAVVFVLKLTLASVGLGWGYAGISVGSSAATRRGRWAMLIALGFFFIPDALAKIVWGRHALPVGPLKAAQELLDTLINGGGLAGWFGLVMLLLYGALGLFVTTRRVRREMTP
jgi:ABC-type transport system involved in multi-copper enzyme maturation permease subunit